MPEEGDWGRGAGSPKFDNTESYRRKKKYESDAVHTENRKIMIHMMDARLRASPRHGGQGGGLFFF
jgi:hypothetical protein